MSVRVGDDMHKVIFPDWRSLPIGRGWSDTFVFPISVYDGLPPMRRTKMLRDMANKVAKIRRSASIWIPVDGPDGIWFRREVQRSLRGLVLPYAVTPASVKCPRVADFSFIPWTDRVATPAPPDAPSMFTTDLNRYELDCLHLLARIRSASTIEVASLAGCSIPTARHTLKSLMEDGFVFIDDTNQIPVWQLTRRGISLSLRSWGVPAGIAFPGYKERDLKSSRHRRTTRLWLAWLRKAWPQAEIWAGWSEVTFGFCWPDALAWGKLDGFETLFWLEVESGHRSRKELTATMQQRFNRAIVYTRCFTVRLVFVILGPQWVQDVVDNIFYNLPHETAVVMGNWFEYGELSFPKWHMSVNYTLKLP